MAELLHRKRLAGKSKRRHRYDNDDLPNGSMIAFGDDAFAVRRQNLVRWTPSGYSESKSRPCDRDVDVLTGITAPDKVTPPVRSGSTASARWCATKRG